MAPREKPQGQKGPLRFSGGQPEWAVVDFPKDKKARELMIAGMFTRAANVRIDSESPEEPHYGPFENLIQNEESDLDFTTTTARGQKRMELAEFAPLASYGPQFKDVPTQVHQAAKSDHLLELVQMKSVRQGGPNRLLLIYVTEEAFRLDPITIEIARRALARNPPKFERVYYVSPHDSTIGSVDEIFPGKPHHICGSWSDEQLRTNRAHFFHPTEMLAISELSGTMQLRNWGECSFKLRYLMPVSASRQKR